MVKHKINESRLRSIIKGITGRVIEVVFDTFIITILGVDIYVSLTVSIFIEVACFIVNYLNERCWNLTDFGRTIVNEEE